MSGRISGRFDLSRRPESGYIILSRLLTDYELTHPTVDIRAAILEPLGEGQVPMKRRICPSHGLTLFASGLSWRSLSSPAMPWPW
jgi:hypothetical protein